MSSVTVRRTVLNTSIEVTAPTPPDFITPTVTAITPDQIDPYGGCPVRITGTNFQLVSSVTIGGVECTDVTRVDNETIDANSPELPIGADYDVEVIGLQSAALADAVEVWYPTEIAGANVYDPERGVTGDPVSVWTDQAGLDDLAQATLALRPAYDADRFGSSDRIGLTWDTEAATVMTIAAPAAFTRRTVFCAIKWTGDGNASQSEIISGTAGAILDFALDDTGGETTMRVYDANALGNRRSPDDSELGDGNAEVIGCYLDGVAGLIQFYRNNVQQGPDVTVTPSAANWNKVGAGVGNLSGYEMGGLVVATAAITDTERAKLVKWLYGKFVARSFFTRTVTLAPTWFARDGSGLLLAASVPYVYLVGGWNSQGSGQFGPINPNVTNEVYRAPASDPGTFTLIRANDETYPPVDFFPPQHTAGWLMATILGQEYIYSIGSDSFNDGDSPAPNGDGHGNSSVWRIPINADGSLGAAQLVTTDAPLDGCVLQIVAFFNGAIYLMGGQTDFNDNSTVSQRVAKSVDGGFTWERLPDAPWAGRGMVYDPCVLNGKLWLIGGGAYYPPRADNCYNDVWSFDESENWTEELANGHDQWQVRCYHNTRAFEGRLWLINGATDPNVGIANGEGNIRQLMSSADGRTWIDHTIIPWQASHADGSCVLSDRLLLQIGNGGVGHPSDPGVGSVFSIGRNGFTPP